ncbi:MAG: SulP family inorganic anion transporter [Chlamydiales bacterium]|nr:SulP family inorganic anion transporter [Chlamydiales bacterium]
MHYRLVSLFPFWKDLKRYNLESLWRDSVAALSVALLALPQAMAYAFVANLPPSAGIFAAIFGTIFTATFGASRYLISGPTTAIAILIQSGTSQILFTYFRDVSGPQRDIIALNIVMQIVILVGIFQILASLLRLGRLTQFASRSVIVGYMLGVAVAIAINQIHPFFGMKAPEGYYPLYMRIWYFITGFTSLQLPTLFLGICCFVLIALLYRLSSKIPAAVIVFVLAGLFVYYFPISTPLLREIGPLYTDLPKISLPGFQTQILIAAVPLAFAIAIISLLEATSIGRFYTRSKEPPYRTNQELFGLGISNFLSAFLGAMPSSGSFSRTALNRALNAKTRFSAVYSGLFLFVIVILFAFLVARVPITALSALLLYISYTMINFRDLTLCLRATRTDFFVVLTTFVASLIFTLDVALYIGIILSILLYLKQAGVPLLIEYGFNNSGKLRPLEVDEERLDPRICILQAEGQLFFGAADPLISKVRRIADDEEIEVVILQLFNVHSIDASICLAIRQLYRYLKGTGRTFMITGISRDVLQTLRRSSVNKEIGEENIFEANEQLPSEPTRNAYATAKYLLSTKS